ncbi:MAG: hypothetical protein IJZ19_09560 [Lentisphaeria bacterium]|nr:hypothetical protein [Lentisphaeria bacterium]
MKKILTSTLLAAASLCMAFTEKFDTAERFLPADFPVMAKEGGVDNSPCAVFNYNGQHLALKVAPVTDRPFTLTAKIKLDVGKSYFRVAFGSDKMNWRTHYGSYELYGKDTEWHTVKFVVTPNPVKEGTYQVWLDGKLVRTAKWKAADGPVTQIQFRYLSQKADGKVYLDDVGFLYGAKINFPPQESMLFKFPPADKRKTTADHAVLPFTVSGNVKALKNYKAELLPLRKNFFREAEKTPVGRAELTFSGNNAGSVKLSEVPYGLHALTISAEDAKGKRHIIKQEYFARWYKTPPKAAPSPMRWCVDSHIERSFWKQELQALADVGANWTRLEMNMANTTVPNKPGWINFAHHDKVIAEAEKMGINIFFLINCRPQWGGNTPLSNLACLPDLKSLEQVCRTIMTRYKGRIFWYEIYNEPQHYNWNHFEPGITNEEHFGKMLQVAVKVAAEVDPRIKVMGPCLTVNMNAWIAGIARTGGFDTLQYLSYHVNDFPAYIGQFYLRYVKELTGKELKPFVSESSNDLRRLIASFAGEVPSASFGYTILDKGLSENNYEHYNGWMRQDGIPKNIFIRYQFLATVFNRAEYRGRIFSAEGLNGYLFKENGQLSAVVWAGEKDKLPKLAFAKGVQRFDRLGNPFKGDKLSRTILKFNTVPDEQLMCVIRNIPADAPEVLASSVNWKGDYKLFDKRSEKVKVTFANPGKTARDYKLEFLAGNGLSFSNPISVKVPAGKTVEKEITVMTSPTAPAKEIYINAKVTIDGKTIDRRFGPVRVFNPDRVKTIKVWQDKKANPLTLPHDAGDIHSGHSTGVARDIQDHNKATAGSGFEVVTVPGVKNPVGRLNYVFNKPGKGWLPSIWLARRYTFKKPIPIPGIPIKLDLKVFMEDNIKNYPTVPVFTFRDPTGKELRIEGGNYFYTGWRNTDCYLPSLYTHGRLHSVGGGNKIAAVDAYPLELTGVIINLVPLSSSVHAPKNLPAVKGYLLYDDLRITYYE